MGMTPLMGRVTRTGLGTDGYEENDMSKQLEKNLQQGDLAPDFELPAHTGERMSLAELRGKPVVLYFYPKDNTPGCTVEAKEFRDEMEEFQRAGAVVLGISPDSVESHGRFADKFGLNFMLLCDKEHEVAQKYGAWAEKTTAGKTYWGINRSTFLIGADGKIAHIWPKVSPAGHAEEVLRKVREV
jgi:peroxiredoxin Q/BCP